jgi:hypothetical protein
MAHIALHRSIHTLEVAAGGTASPLDALHALMVEGVRCCSSYLFSS